VEVAVAHLAALVVERRMLVAEVLGRQGKVTMAVMVHPIPVQFCTPVVVAEVLVLMVETLQVRQPVVLEAQEKIVSQLGHQQHRLVQAGITLVAAVLAGQLELHMVLIRLALAVPVVEPLVF
jgi:hypothetical protein